MSFVDSTDFPAHADAEDLALFRRVRADDPFAAVKTVTPLALQELAATRGAAYATAAIYLRLMRSADARLICDEAEHLHDTPPGEPPHVVIMPGAFHLHHKNTGADGQNVRAMARRLGWSSEVVPVGSLGSLDQNAAALIDHLRKCDAGKIVLVSLSKGSADVAAALAKSRDPDPFEKVLVWVSLSGLTFGTPLVDWLGRQWWRMPFVHMLLWSKGLRFGELAELTYGPAARLTIAPPLPSHLTAIHVLGFPCRKHLRHPWATRGYNRLLPLGPNDGGGILLADSERLPGVVVPVWGADHYLAPSWDFSPILRNVLLHAARSQTIASAIPATRSIK